MKSCKCPICRKRSLFGGRMYMFGDPAYMTVPPSLITRVKNLFNRMFFNRG